MSRVGRSNVDFLLLLLDQYESSTSNPIARSKPKVSSLSVQVNGTEELFELYAHRERGKNVGCQVPDISSPPDRRQILSAANVDEYFFFGGGGVVLFPFQRMQCDLL